MRVDVIRQDRLGQEVVVTLSRRNLEALLVKLQGHPRDSAAAITRQQIHNGSLVTLCVAAEPDEVHYADRKAGDMHPETESAMSKRRTRKAK